MNRYEKKLRAYRKKRAQRYAHPPHVRGSIEAEIAALLARPRPASSPSPAQWRAAYAVTSYFL